ncbi:hypothetical protein BJ138DRAFT_940864 [Hygrophoropsis aurantiaca]|uniref:Uncharacterized protein n=1 Tax=Hygrophoropsis aurantiaca TaxID=72124 RepID=A0ACB8AD32_9AGAM|nr:hypothetical protein BJ138DRAFT_940864 [Hygrophoropsis aurantiaca]
MIDEPMNARKVSLETLPHDILYHIIRSISIQDMFRLQQTSTFFRALFETRSIWSEAYRSTSLPLHAGPFPHQSTQTLKHALAKTDKVSRNWAPYTPKPTQTRSFHIDGFISIHVLARRWLIGHLDDGRSIACVDMDRASKPGELIPQAVIYQCEEGMRISFHECLTTVGLEGHTLAISVLHEGPWDEKAHMFVTCEAARRSEAMKIFKVTGLDGPGPALGFEFMASYPLAWDPMQADWTCAIAPRLLVIAKEAQCGDNDDETLYIDLESFKTYTVSLPLFQGGKFFLFFVSCATHLLVFRRAEQKPIDERQPTDNVWNTTLDTLALPVPGTGFHHCALKISHHAQFSFDISEAHVLHDPALAPWKHETRIVLLAKVSPDISGLSKKKRKKKKFTDPNLSVVRVALTDRDGDSDDSGIGTALKSVTLKAPHRMEACVRCGCGSRRSTLTAGSWMPLCSRSLTTRICSLATGAVKSSIRWRGTRTAGGLATNGWNILMCAGALAAPGANVQGGELFVGGVCLMVDLILSHQFKSSAHLEHACAHCRVE